MIFTTYADIGTRIEVTNLANASSLIYSSLAAYDKHFGTGDKAVNWCGAYSNIQFSGFCSDQGPLLYISGFYIDAPFFPVPRGASQEKVPARDHQLLLGPFCGKPACQFINVAPGKARGVCADAYVQRRTKLVPDVDAYPGHIACDGETKSEIVCPLILRENEGEIVVGVLDLDSLSLSGFDEQDQAGLERIAELIVKACDW